MFGDECSDFDLMPGTLGREEPLGTGTAGGRGTSHSLGPTLNSGLPHPHHSTLLVPWSPIFGDWHHSHELAKQIPESSSWHLPFPHPHQPVTAQSCQFCMLHISLDWAPEAATLDYGSSLLTGLPAVCSLVAIFKCKPELVPFLLKPSRACL